MLAATGNGAQMPNALVLLLGDQQSCAQAQSGLDFAAMDSRIREIEELMQRQLDRKLLVTELARTVALSPSRFRCLFKNQIGASPNHHLKSLRMRKARELLETSRLSVKEVSARLGYRDTSRFVEDFRKLHGLPPKQYRAWFCNSRAPGIVSRFCI